jgi:phosphate:Na+ symporter
MKLFLVSVNGQAVKKRVALGNFLFNIITVVLIFIFLYPVNLLIKEVVGINDNLVALVFFQTLINLFCIILFFPFLDLLGKYLLKRYPDSEEESFYIRKMPVTDTDIAIEALENETKHFITLVINYSLDAFNVKGNQAPSNIIYKKFSTKSLSEKYDYIKHLHGEMHGFYLQILNVSQREKKMERLEQLVTSIRNAMYAAKSIRDARHDIEQISNSSNNVKYDFYVQSAKKSSAIYQQILKMLDEKGKVNYFEQLTALYKNITEGYSETLQLLYKNSMATLVNETEISTLINFNREIYTSYKSILFSIKDYLLTPKDAEYFDGLPGFIR